MEAFGIVGAFTFIISIVILIVFFVMASNIGKCVTLLRGIYHELKISNDPTIQKAKKFDADNN
jgi:hypothetical protein